MQRTDGIESVGTDTEEQPSREFAIEADSDALAWLDDGMETIHLEWIQRRRHGNDFHSEETSFVHPDYTYRNSNADTKSEAFEMWMDMEFPRIWGDLHGKNSPRADSGQFDQPTLEGPDGRVYSQIRVGAWANFLQHPDGSGYIEWRGTDPAWVRTKSGLLLASSEDLKTIRGGWWRVSYVHPPGIVPDWTVDIGGRADDRADYELPLNSIQEMDGLPPLVDIESVDAADEGHAHYIHFSGNKTVVVLRDDSAKQQDDEYAGFVIDRDEEPVLPPVGEAEMLLMPEKVRSMYLNGWEVLTSDRFAAGADFGHAAEGNCIIRQGEWYLVPKPEGWTPDEPIHKCLPVPDRKHDVEIDHLDSFHGNSIEQVDDLPRECDCGETSLTVRRSLACCECTECGRHYLWEDEGISLMALTEQERQRYENAKDILGSHTPRDLTFDSEMRPTVRGTFRHTGDEHEMLRVDQWHELHENTRDVTVFSMRRGNYARGAGRGEMRVE